MTTIGLYLQPPTAQQQHHYAMLSACGYNDLEFLDGGFGVRPDELPRYYADLAAQVATAQGHGFNVGILLLAGMNQWSGPEPGGNPGTFSVLDRRAYAERLGHLRQAVRALRGADRFAFFAGDPGGDPEGRATLDDCLDFAADVRAIVREEAPQATFVINLWAIAEWAGFPSPFSLEFWRQQVRLSRAVAESDRLADTGLVFSLDGYYRSLTLAAYEQAGETPERFPTALEIQRLRQRGIGPLLGWPYFLIDEIDDGFMRPNNVATGGQAGAEVRYLKAIIDHGRALGLDGMIGNASFIAAEALNLYAFGRLCRDPSLTPEAVLEDFAALVADDDSAADLALVLRFVENHSNWQASLPERYRLPALAVAEVTTPEAALARLARVVPRASRPVELPQPPAMYLDWLHKRLARLAAGEVDGVAPLLPADD